GGVGDLHAGQVGAHLLEVHQRFHAALRALRLVGRVGRVPGRVLADVAQDHLRRVGAVVALADEAAEDLVLPGDGADAGQRLFFGQAAAQRERVGGLDGRRDDGVGQGLERVVADGLEHGGDFSVVRADVAADEGVVLLEFAQGRSVLGHGGGPDWGMEVRRAGAAGCPSVLLPESLEDARTRSRASCPFGAGAALARGRSLQSVCSSGGIGPERLRAFAPSAAGRGRLLPPGTAGGIIPWPRARPACARSRGPACPGRQLRMSGSLHAKVRTDAVPTWACLTMAASEGLRADVFQSTTRQCGGARRGCRALSLRRSGRGSPRSGAMPEPRNPQRRRPRLRGPAVHMTTRSTRTLTLLLAGLAMFGPFSIDTIFPAFPQMAAQFGADKVAMQQTISVYLLSYALMSIVHGPLSDALGRRRVILAGLVVFTLASVGCALSGDLPTLLAFRALQGLSAGVGLIVGRAVIRDVLQGDDAQRLMSHVSMIFGIAPAIAPILGGWMLGAGRWPLIFWFLAAF